ncbi:MAG: hypothetical protein ACRYG6_12765 [Janthinobacterium lividum]
MSEGFQAMDRLPGPVQAPGAGEASGPDRAARVLERFRDERLRLEQCRLPTAAAALLAARNAGTLATTGACGLPLDAALPPALWPFEALRGDLPAPGLLERCAVALCGTSPDAVAADVVARGWELARSAESLLVQGGDERLALDPASGLNRYGCAPHPRPGVTEFASCTSSSVSSAGLAAAEGARHALLAEALRAGHRAAVDAGCAAAASRILGHYGVQGAAAFVVPSGTDAALLATAAILARLRGEGLEGGAVTCLLVDPAETGSGVPAAARARHFADATATGAAVARGEPLAGCPVAIGLETVALRAASGEALPLRDIDDAFERALERCCAAGHVILHQADCSKTGLVVPGAEACRRWSVRFGARLTVVVDASQARLDAAEVRRSLDAGWPVILTGSKFFGGPGFCGALLLPGAQAGAMADAAPLMAGLGAYAAGLAADPARAEWHAGLVLRWAVALREMDAFRGHDAAGIEARLREHGRRIVALVRADPRLALVAAGGSAPEGLASRSIFPFTVRAPDADRLMRPDELGVVHDWLGRDLGEVVGAARSPASGGADAGRWRQVAASRCRIGQPVRLGYGPDGPPGGLRIALGAAHLLEEDDGGAALSLVFAKLGLVLDHFADLPGPDHPAA